MFLISTIILGGLLVILYYLNNLKEYIRYQKLLNKLPGPKPYSILGNIPDLCDEVNLFKKLRCWSQEFYPVYRLSIGPVQTAVIAGPHDFEAIAGTMKNLEKSPWYKFFHLWIGDGLVTGSGPNWQSRRKIVTPAFNVNMLQQFVAAFTKHTDQLVQTFREVCHNPHVNVMPYLAQYSMDIVNETSMGVKLSLENEEYASYCNAIIQIGNIIMYRLTRPWLFFNTVFYNLTSLGHKEREFVNIINNFTRKVVSERSKTFQELDLSDGGHDEIFRKKKKLVLLDILLNAKVKGAITDDGVNEEVNTFTTAAYDTSSTVLSFILMLLAQHRDVQDSILEELNTVLGDPKAQPTYNDLQELKFMERCIKEGLRLYPSVPHIGRTLEEDVKTSNGYVLPKGTMVQIFIYDIHRNPKVWPNPDKFDPNRFLPENSQSRHPFAYVPFSIGPRNCIGQKFAMLQMKVALCGIIRNFILEPVDTPENIVLVPYILLSPKDHTLRVKLVPRETI